MTSSSVSNKTNTLNAVNIIISNIGQSPVTSLEGGNPLVEMAELILNEVSRSVQAEGWHFNIEYCYPFTPATSAAGTKVIEIPDNVLALDTNPNSADQVSIRGGFLYNRTDHTFVFDKKQELDVIWLESFDDIPEVFRYYITVRAANVFAGRSVGSAEAVRFGEREEILARASAMEYETQQGDYSILADRGNGTTYKSYLPIQTLYR